MKSITCMMAALLMAGPSVPSVRAADETQSDAPASQEPAYTGEPLRMESEEVTLSGMTERVDAEQRSLKVKTSDGNSVTLKVVPEVEGLEKIKAGDLVHVNYLRSVAVFLHKTGETVPPEEAVSAVQLAPRGDQPEATLVNTIEMVGVVESVDRENKFVTVRGPDNEKVRLSVPDGDPNFDRIQQGDQIVARYSEALALGVRKA